MQLVKNLQAALLYHWNLLALAGGMGFAVLSGHWEVFAPLVLAGEVAYLGLLGTHPKFQKYLAAQEAKGKRAAGTSQPEETVAHILQALPPPLVQRFEDLRQRCRELRQIAQEMRDLQQAGAPPLEEMQLAGLDRLLWIYLRLLFTQHSLGRFLQKTGEPQIQRDIQTWETRLGQQPEAGDDPQRQKVRKAIEDNLATSRARLANLQKARENYELVQLETDRLENKIRSLSELAVNRQEPDFISGQVDQVAAGMVQTERTMSDLQFITGLETDDTVPELVRREPLRVKE